jgi:hypothetical protein
MPTTREAILSALHALLRTQPAPVLRGEVLPERVPAAGLLILRDGDPGEPAVTLSPLRYHYQHRAEVEVVVQGAARDASFDALCAGIGAAFAVDRTLGGWCDWIEAEAPRPVDLPIEGAAALKAAVIPIILHYSMSDPLGAATPEPPAPEPEPLPANLIPDPEARFDAKGAWKTAGTWTVAGGVADRSASPLSENLEYDVAIPAGWTLVSFRIAGSNLQAGVLFQLGGPLYSTGEARNRIGWHAHLIPSAGHTRTRWVAQGGWAGAIDDVSVRDVTAIQARPADVYILAGQSNMAGGQATPVDPSLDAPHPLVTYLAGTTATHLGGKTGELRPAVDPLQHYDGAIMGVGPGMAAARSLLAALAPGRRIVLIAAAKGGTALVDAGAPWQPGVGAAYLNAIAQAQLAMSLLPAGSAIRGLFWSQGESDNGTNVGTLYPPAFRTMLTALRADLALPDLPAVILGPTPEGDPDGRLAAAQASLDGGSGSANATPGVRFVAGPAGMTIDGDDAHFSPAGNRKRGADGAAAMAALLG